MNSLKHFASSTMALMFEVYDVYDNESHPAREALLNDLGDIPQEVVEWYKNENEMKFLFDIKDTPIEERLLVFIDLVSKEIDKLRIQSLLNKDKLLPLPYNHSSLSGIELDNNFLVKSNELEIVPGGFCRNNQAFVLSLGTNAINSSHWLFDSLFSIERTDLIKVRLDPLIHESADTFNPMVFKMQVYGTSLNWNIVKEIKEAEHTQFLPEFPSSKDIYRTDVVWKPVGDEIHFTCEEIPIFEVLTYRGSRYFHGIFQRETGFIKHCDAAIRFYDPEEYEKRISKHIKSSEVTRIGKRIKIFQIDIPKTEVSSELVGHEDFINLVTSFFVWNQDVFNYFNKNEQIRKPDS